MTRHVTMVRAYYDNPQMLARHIGLLSGLSKRMRKNLTNIICDDCSPKWPAIDVFNKYGTGGVHTRLFRLLVDKRFNWLGARNRAMHEAAEGWCLITDMDHVASEATLDHLMEGEFDERAVYRFSRREHTGEIIHPHPNSWFMTRAMFWKIGGFNEAASGYYGTDGSYRRRVAELVPNVVMLPDQLIRYEKLGDSGTLAYARKQPEDAIGKQILREWGNKPPRVLSFPWEEQKVSKMISLRQSE
jgi:hypothetical protein